MALEFKLLLILITANGVPIILRYGLRNTFSYPVDGGLLLADGYPLFGYAKTWRGIFSGITTASIITILFGFPLLFGITFSLLSLLGDLLSSFIKRRLKRPPSTPCIGIDQLPEALLPLIVGTYWLDYQIDTVLIVTLSFFIVNLFIPTLISLLRSGSSRS
jgi:CDP-diglyceride synthetase